MRSLFLPKCQLKILRISALPSNKIPGHFGRNDEHINSFWNQFTFYLYPRVRICWLWLKHGGKFWFNYLHGNSHGKPALVIKYYSKAFSLFPTPGLCRLLTAWAWYSNVFYIHYLAPFLAYHSMARVNLKWRLADKYYRSIKVHT